MLADDSGADGVVEGFQASLADQAKNVLKAFFPLWNNYPTGFTKAADINVIKWTTANAVNISSVDYTGSGFNSLNSNIVSSYSIPFSISNSTSNSSLTFRNIRLNGQVVSNISININSATTTQQCSCGPYSCQSLSGRPYDGGSYVLYGQCYARCGIMTIQRTIAYSAYSFGQPTCVNVVVPQTTSANLTIPVSPQAVVGSVSFDVIFPDTKSATITINAANYTGSYSQTFLTLQGLLSDFQNFYTALLIDFYTSLVNRHSTNTVVPYTAPTTANAPSYAPTDRSNAIAGTNVSTLQTNYLTNFLPALYTSIYNQVNAMMTNLSNAWSKMTATEKTPFSSLTVDADKTTMDGISNLSNTTNLIANLITMTNLYNKYQSQYSTIIDIPAKAGAQTAMESFYKDTYIPCIRYLTGTDGQDPAIQSAVQKSLAYWMNANGSQKASFVTPLTAGDTYTTLGTTVNTGITTLVQRMVRSYSTMRAKYTGFGMTTTSTAIAGADPTVTDANAVATRTTYMGATYWPQLMTDIQAFVKARIAAASYLQTWKTTAQSGTIAATSSPTALPATKGLGIP